VGYPRNRFKSCIRVISKKMNPNPRPLKKIPDIPFLGSALQTRWTFTKGKRRKIVAMSTDSPSSKTSTRSPTAFSRSGLLKRCV